MTATQWLLYMFTVVALIYAGTAVAYQYAGRPGMMQGVLLEMIQKKEEEFLWNRKIFSFSLGIFIKQETLLERITSWIVNGNTCGIDAIFKGCAVQRSSNVVHGINSETRRSCWKWHE